MGILAAGGLPDAVVRAFFIGRTGPEDARSLITTTLALAIAVASLAAVTGPVWSELFSEIGYGAELKIATWTSVGVAGVLSIQGLLRSQERAGAFVITVGLTSVGAQTLGVAATAIFGGASAYLGGLAAGYGLALAVGLALSTGVRLSRPAPGILRTAFGIGLPVIPHSLALYVMSAGDRIVVETLEGVAAVGRYYLAYVVGSLGFLLIQAINQAWAPVIYGADDDRRWQVLSDTAASFTRLAALMGGALAIGSPVVLAALAPPSYELDDLTAVAVVVAAATVPTMIYVSHVHTLFWLTRTRILAVATPIAAALNIGLNLALIPLIGLTGAAIATLAAICAQTVIIVIASRRLAPVPWHDRTFAVALATLGLLCVIGLIQPSTGPWLVLRAVESAALVGAMVAIGVRGIRGAGAEPQP